MEVIGRSWIYQLYDLECCSGSPALKWSVGVVFIATNYLVATNCLVCHHVSQPLGLGAGRSLEALSSCGTGQSGAAPDRNCSLFGAPLTMRSLPRTVPRVRYFCSRPLREVAIPPLAHRTVRWFLAECACWNSRVASWTQYGPGAPDTVR
jgi:hypothetical protein